MNTEVITISVLLRATSVIVGKYLGLVISNDFALVGEEGSMAVKHVARKVRCRYAEGI